jgi:hypothetical protein
MVNPCCRPIPVPTAKSPITTRTAAATRFMPAFAGPRGRGTLPRLRLPEPAPIIRPLLLFVANAPPPVCGPRERLGVVFDHVQRGRGGLLLGHLSITLYAPALVPGGMVAWPRSSTWLVRGSRCGVMVTTPNASELTVAGLTLSPAVGLDLDLEPGLDGARR